MIPTPSSLLRWGRYLLSMPTPSCTPGVTWGSLGSQMGHIMQAAGPFVSWLCTIGRLSPQQWVPKTRMEVQRNWDLQKVNCVKDSKALQRLVSFYLFVKVNSFSSCCCWLLILSFPREAPLDVNAANINLKYHILYFKVPSGHPFHL